ncbi:hypothetical protein jhhlp_007591 [Lomentospora prolificans]|uniref:Cytochrome P450 n=1 Tax=Lomentospora prolificans TaxID=41688 RepID=A0A2N3N028_9PEZI|nr:hypothetical protein jhhlp_007591 [Lomentospora prolificans]
MAIAIWPTVATVGGVAVAYATCSALLGLTRNIKAAKKSGLPYIISPVSPFWLPAQLTQKIWMPIVRTCLPKSLWENWITFLLPDWSYIYNHQIFSRHGPAFLVVSPHSAILLTDNAEIIRQVTQRREHFPKLVETYEILKQFGDNTLTTEGALWRVHRRATAASFNERNAALVFAVAIEQTEGMLEKWMADQEGGPPVGTIDHDTMRLALNIIGYVGFGLRLLWPGQRLPEGSEGRLEKYTSLVPVGGHTMSFIDTIATVLERILWLLVLPEWLLRFLPFKKTRDAAEAYTNYIKYMDELLEEKLEQMRKGDVEKEPGMDIMGQLVCSTYGDATSANGKLNGATNGFANRTGGRSTVETGKLTKSDIIGNAFIMLVAGHETTANALHFTLLELAANPSAQRALQRDVDALLGDRDPRTWSYEGSVGPLLANMVGACMNETLRKMPSVVEVPKKVVGCDQVVTLDGENVVLPKDTAISLVAVSAHRNPRYWPTKRSKISGSATDLDDYVPERWFRKRAGPEDGESSSGSGAAASSTREADDDGAATDEDFGGYTGPDTSAQLFRPERGAYIPFSDGARSCLGRRIAQVEIVAALAVLFQRYSLELDVVDFVARGGSVEDMGRAEKERVYGMAQERCRRRMGEATSVLTLKMHGGEDVPVRLVRRGEERFVSWME